MTKPVERMMELFAGRGDAYGADDGRAIWRPVTPELVEAHLDGIEGIGIYSIRHLEGADGKNPDMMVVKWGCCDIDTGDWSEAYMLATALQGMGLVPWVERSRSKGWHIWIFSPEWIPAWVMRRCLKVAYSVIDLPAREANPKSELLQPQQLGNYVRLPYKGANVLGRLERQTMMTEWGPTDDGHPLWIKWFCDRPNKDIYSDPAKIRHWADKWYEPPRKLKVDAEAMLDDEQLMALVNGLPERMRQVWLNGPTRSDRSEALVGMAYAMAKLGLLPKDVYQLIAAADLRWGKYHQRDNGELYIADIVERAFS